MHNLMYTKYIVFCTSFTFIKWSLSQKKIRQTNLSFEVNENNYEDDPFLYLCFTKANPISKNLFDAINLDRFL